MFALADALSGLIKMEGKRGKRRSTRLKRRRRKKGKRGGEEDREGAA